MKKNYWISLTICLLLIGCANQSSNTPENIIPRIKMIDVLTDIHIFDAVIAEKKFKTNKHEYQIEGYYSYLYEKHGYSRAQIDSSVKYYSKDPEDYSKMYDKVLEKLNTIQSYYEKKDKKSGN